MSEWVEKLKKELSLIKKENKKMQAESNRKFKAAHAAQDKQIRENRWVPLYWNGPAGEGCLGDMFIGEKTPDRWFNGYPFSLNLAAHEAGKVIQRLRKEAREFREMRLEIEYMWE